MPSSYSPNLRIELIGDGEQYDSWGDTTNTNLGTLIEDAIAGLAVVSVTSADQALTAVDGGADQSRNAILSLTTTTSADFNVYAPPVSKLYVIHNASSYTATVYNSTSEGNTTAAGAGVAVPAGAIMAVWSDGANLKSQITHIPSAVLGSGSANSGVFLRGDRQWSAVDNLAASSITSGTIATARLGSGTADSTTFLRGDNAWAVVEGMPAGSVIYFAASTPPTGYLKANGAAVSRSTYAALFSAIGTTFGSGDGSTTFNVPDLRGEFVRGWDDGRGVDSGRVFGSAQAQSTQDLYARITGQDGNVRLQYQRISTPSWSANLQDDDNNTGASGTKTTGVAVAPLNTGETRPSNVALLACIKF